ncbi:MAG: serine/threonine-protein kinase [Polyangiaceae bacterium]
MTEDPSTNARQQIEALLVDRPYRLVRLLGQGSMGEVWVVRHTALESDMALKVLHVRHLRSAFHRERFLLEARVTASIHHPNVVRVIDYWDAPDQRPCFVMQLLAGNTLDRELRARNCLPSGEAVELGYQVASALQAAHAAGFIHRDIKLDNIFLHRTSPAGFQAKLLDFGLARVVSPATTAGFLAPTLATQTGSMVGSPRFMSPEALRGELVDHRGDLYSLGIVLYMALVGRNYLFDWATRPVFAPPSQLSTAQCPPELDAVILRAVEPRKEDRYQSAAELLAALQPLRPTPAQSSFTLPLASLSVTRKREDQ